MQESVSMSGEREMKRRLSVACSAAEGAGEKIKAIVEGGDLGTREKGDRDVVTRADMLAERSIVQALEKHFPGDGVVAEEGTQRDSRSGITWYLDPLDGTLNFSRSVPIWCVSIAAFRDNRPVLGVVHDPIRQETFWAAQGSGAYLNGRRIEVSKEKNAASCIVHLTVDFHDDSLVLGLEDIAAIAPHVLRTRNIGAVALALAYCAAGRLDAVIHRYANPWDYGAGVILVQEAAGKVSGLDSREYAVTTRSLLASASSSLQQEILALIDQRA